MTQRQTCCSSPAAMFYWLSTSLLAWGILGLTGIYWNPLRAASATTICLAVAIGCGANWFRNRTLHCALTGPIFLVAGSLFLLLDTRHLAISPTVVWVAVAVLTGVAFLLECGYAAWFDSRECPDE